MDRPELQKASVKLGENLQGLASALTGQRQLFTSLHVYPLPAFPGHTKEGLLQQLVRKKLDVKAEDWIEESVSIGRDQERNYGPGAMKQEDLQDLWSSAKEMQLDILSKLNHQPGWDDVYTIQERKAGVDKVVTGLKRDLDEDDDSEDEEGEGNGEGEGEGEDELAQVDRMDVSVVEQEEVEAPAANGLNSTLPPLPLDSMLKYVHGQDVP